MMKKINKDAKRCLQRAYNHLAAAVEAVADLEQIFRIQKDKRIKVAQRTAELIMKTQTKLNPLAEDDDIRIV